jgi:hypothetical protein
MFDFNKLAKMEQMDQKKTPEERDQIYKKLLEELKVSARHWVVFM